MPSIIEHSNSTLYDAAVETLLEMGFQVWHDCEKRSYRAERDGWDFWADTPCGLLGLAAIYDHLRPSEYIDRWWEARGTISTSPRKLPERPKRYTPVAVLSHRVVVKAASRRLARTLSDAKTSKRSKVSGTRMRSVRRGTGKGVGVKKA